ncbi:MAG: hypothetical protein AAF214_09470, partial [Pseudomonadota bacterium]
LVAPDDSDTPGDRAVKVLKSLGGLSDERMTMVGTRGMHSFNALPPEGDYKTLMTGDVDANITSMLVEPGRKMATEKLTKERAVYLYDKQMEAAASSIGSDSEKDLIRAAFGDRPTTEMTPAELNTHISSKLDAAKTAIANRKATKWQANQTTPPTPEELQKKKDAVKADYDSYLTGKLQDTLIRELGAPEFVVADSNWGDAKDHNLFVIAPDPLTGEPRMWQKSILTGSMNMMDDDWLKAEWQVEE